MIISFYTFLVKLPALIILIIVVALIGAAAGYFVGTKRFPQVTSSPLPGTTLSPTASSSASPTSVRLIP